MRTCAIDRCETEARSEGGICHTHSSGWYKFRHMAGIDGDLSKYVELRNQVHCDICCTHENAVHRSGGDTRRLHIDHDHATQTVRGVLCRSCNHLVGNLEAASRQGGLTLERVSQLSLDYLNGRLP